MWPPSAAVLDLHASASVVEDHMTVVGLTPSGTMMPTMSATSRPGRTWSDGRAGGFSVSRLRLRLLKLGARVIETVRFVPPSRQPAPTPD